MLRFPFVLIASGIISFLAGGCSIHPIPDDVSPYSTHEIVRNVRCEAKQAVRERIGIALVREGIGDIAPDDILQPAKFSHIERVNRGLALKFRNYMDSAIAYDFEFLITEDNNAGGSVGFLMPFSSGGKVTLSAGGGINKTRTGERRFKMVETFQDLVKLRCDGFEKPSENFLYPMTGSIGIDKVMNTFIDLSELGGGKEQFTDTITFVTKVSGNVGSSVELAPVTDQFRLVSASAGTDSQRIDTHKLLVSLKFPTGDLRLAQADSFARDGASVSGGQLSKVQALENLCIARAEQREDAIGTLRLYPPEVYCRRKDALHGTLDRLVE